MQKKINIDNVRPIWQVVDDSLLMRTGSYSYFYELELNPIFTMDEFDYDNALLDFQRVFNLLPDYTVIHKMDIFTEDTYSKNNISEDINDPLIDSFFSKYLEKKYLTHKSYLFISKTDSRILKKSSLSSLIFKKNVIPKELISQDDYDDFKKALFRVEQVLNDSRFFKIKKMSVDESIDLLHKYENLDFSNLKYSSTIVQDQNKTKIGNKFVSSVAINSLDCLPNNFRSVYIDPKYRNDNSFIPFSFLFPVGLDLNFNHIVNQVFIKSSKEIVKDNLKKVDLLNNTFRNADNGNLLNLHDNEIFTSQLEKGSLPIHYHSNVFVYDTVEETIEKKVNSIFSAFNKIKLTPNIASNEILPLYWSCYPGNAADIGFTDQTFLLLDNEAAAMNIYETNSRDNLSSFGVYFNNRLNLTPLFVDISDLPKSKGITNNRNKIIIGPSGSGKSFLTNHLVNSFLRTGSHMVVVDVGGSYKRLCKLRKGKYIEYDDKNPLSFNPFFLSEDRKNDIEKIETIKLLIFSLWKKNGEDFTKDEETIISDGLNEYYSWVEKNNQFMCFNSYYEFMTTVYFPEMKVNKPRRYNLIDADSFENVLSRFYKGGQFDFLLNSEVNIDLFNEPFIVFELDNIKDNKTLFSIVSLMIMDVFIEKMRHLKGTRKVIVIEEAWKPIAQGMAGFVQYLYKTVRKHYGEAWVVTQELNDIIGNEIIKDTIIKNCGAKILLDMKDYRNNFVEIQNLLSLTDKTSNLVLSINQNKIPGEKYKEFFLGLGNEGQVYAVNLSKMEYATYTSEKDEIEIINQLEEKYNSMELALKAYAESLN